MFYLDVEHLFVYLTYESVPVGGIIIFDDLYDHVSVQQFWKDFQKDQGVDETMNRIGPGAGWFRKRKQITINWKHFKRPRDANKKR